MLNADISFETLRTRAEENKQLKKTLSLLELDVEPLFVRPVDLVTLPNKFMELFKYINTYI